MGDWQDITRPLMQDMPVYSGHEQFIKTQTQTVEKDGYNLTHFSMGAHCGTHMDAPAHFLQDGATIEQIDLQTLVGICDVIEITDRSLVSDIPNGIARLLLKTHDFKGLSPEMAQTIVDRGVKLLGIDNMSVAPLDNEAQIHKILLGQGVWLVENLDLSQIQPGKYECICLPLNLVGCEAAPCRALIREVNNA
ncbi:cyclase family protein [Eubacteriales bacterium OttesenSCG-928-N13]|nr:cyclase family protein [Eubacteriales bacterium OttesenSCG-928-N13]